MESLCARSRTIRLCVTHARITVYTRTNSHIEHSTVFTFGKTTVISCAFVSMIQENKLVNDAVWERWIHRLRFYVSIDLFGIYRSYNILVNYSDTRNVTTITSDWICRAKGFLVDLNHHTYAFEFRYLQDSWYARFESRF